MYKVNLKFEAYLLDKETVRLLGVYQETLEVWEAQETQETQEAVVAQWEALKAHYIEVDGPSIGWEVVGLYDYWRSRQFEAYLDEETVRLLGVYQKTLEGWKALEAHCKEAHGLNHKRTRELYWCWVASQ